MDFDCIKSENIKFTFSDDISNDVLEKNCLIEIIINKALLKNILLNSDEEIISKKSLTQRELQILRCLSLGMNNVEISRTMNISIHTTKIHIHSILSKLSAHDRTQAVVEAIRQHLIQI